MTSFPRGILFAALALSSFIKLYLAIFSYGTTDVDAFKDHLDKVREFGVAAYHHRGAFDNPFNSPPPMVHVIKFWGWLSDSSGLPFGFWLRLFPILAGIGIFFLAWRMLRDRANLFPLLLALALNPISIMVDGYHGNTDSLVIALVLLSVYLIQEHKAVAWGAVAFGFACCVKVVPLMFVPAILLYLPNLKDRVRFIVICAAVFVIASLPYITQDPLVVKNALAYGPIYGNWGIPQLLAIFTTVQYAHQPFEPLGVHGVIAAALKYTTWIGIGAVSLWANSQRRSLYEMCGMIIPLVLFLAPGFGPQYLVWLVPFVLLLGLRSALSYYSIAGAYLAFKYLGFPDVAAAWPIGFMLSIGCWLTMWFLFRSYFSVYVPALTRGQRESILVI